MKEIAMAVVILAAISLLSVRSYMIGWELARFLKNRKE